MELPEMQADSVAKICTAKAEAAFQLLGGNVVVQDSCGTWQDCRVVARGSSDAVAGQWLCH